MKKKTAEPEKQKNIKKYQKKAYIGIRSPIEGGIEGPEVHKRVV